MPLICIMSDGSINPGETTSFNYYALRAVADWMHRMIGGLTPTEPGYHRIEISPHPGGGLTHAQAKHLTPYGLAELGFNAYRFSIEWARIEPEEGEFSNAELEHYRRMLATCHEHGIKPVVTFHHFTSPRWLIRSGGWLDEKTPECYARYIERASKHLGDLIGAACTFNEPNLPMILSKLMPFKLDEGPFWDSAAQAFGVTPDRLGRFQFVTNPKMRDVIFASHRRAVDILHAGPGNFPVGLTLALLDIQSAEGGEAKAAEFRRALAEVYLVVCMISNLT